MLVLVANITESPDLVPLLEPAVYGQYNIYVYCVYIYVVYYVYVYVYIYITY